MAARSIEQILRDYLGDQVLTLAKMGAELEALREELATLKAAATGAPVPHTDGPRPNGRDHARAAGGN